MALVFPLTPPASGPASQTFEPKRLDFLAPEASGRLGAMSGAFPLWSAEWSLGQALSQDLSDQWRAFLSALEGPRRLFLAHEYGREFPRAYSRGFGGMATAGGGAFSGAAGSWSQSIASDGQALLTLTGLPAGLALAAGDYVDFRWTTSGQARRSMVRALAAATADGSGVVSGMVVTPAVPTITPGSAVAHLDNPACLMRLSPQTQISPMDRRRIAGARIQAIQDLLP